jgi:hypothetical protein
MFASKESKLSSGQVPPQKAVEVAMEWGRYGNLFEYNFNTGIIQMPKEEVIAAE